MAKKIRFPLKVKNGAEVRTLEELKENFDLESVLGYFTDGRLATWLSDRYYDEKAEAVSALSADMPDLNAKLCEILEVEYQAENDETDVEVIARRREKLRILSSVTDDKEILDNVDLVAMDQDELYDILDEGSNKVYLYGEKFEIPFGKENVSYIGVNTPLVIIDKSKYAEDFEDAGIYFKNVKFEERAYQSNHRYPDPVGEFEIKEGVVIKCKADSNGVCILPYGVTAIGEKAAYYDKSIKKLVIPETVTTIGYCAFSSCENLANFTIPEGVIKIGKQAFSSCNSLTSIKIPSSVSSLDQMAFEGCKNLTSVTIMNSNTFLSSNVFGSIYGYERSKINDVNLPTGMDRQKIIWAFENTPWGQNNGYVHDSSSNNSNFGGNSGGIGGFFKGLFG